MRSASVDTVQTLSDIVPESRLLVVHLFQNGIVYQDTSTIFLRLPGTHPSRDEAMTRSATDGSRITQVAKVSTATDRENLHRLNSTHRLCHVSTANNTIRMFDFFFVIMCDIRRSRVRPR